MQDGSRRNEYLSKTSKWGENIKFGLGHRDGPTIRAAKNELKND